MAEDIETEELGAVPEEQVDAKSASAAQAKAKAQAQAQAKAKANEPPPGAGTEDGARLTRAHVAFKIGDYREVRALARALFEASDPEVARAARELYARTTIDPVQVGVIGVCLALFMTIVYVYVLQ